MTPPPPQAAPDIRAGQVWLEVDPRFERYVRVKDVRPGRRGIAVQTAVPNGRGGWEDAPRSRLSWCDPERFNGKRGGYSLHASDWHRP